jgi:hypothetical protein
MAVEQVLEGAERASYTPVVVVPHVVARYGWQRREAVGLETPRGSVPLPLGGVHHEDLLELLRWCRRVFELLMLERKR